VEEAKVAVRNIRRDANNDLRDMKNEKMIDEDAFHRAQERLQEVTDDFIEQVEQVGRAKELEIMEV
jgi:ribosome recycling factor